VAWIYLVIAGIFEIGWPLGLKFSQQHEYRYMGIVGATLSMALSGYFLWLAQKEIPMGTAYAVWTGIGAAGTFLVGILVFNDIVSFWRIASVSLIILGVIGLKLTT
jgi:quaternary ammonium compound-resistance protein SugE